MNEEKLEKYLSRIAIALESLNNHFETIAQAQRQANLVSTTPRFVEPVEDFIDYDWQRIDARIKRRDEDGIVSVVQWKGSDYFRREDHGDIWFSRNIGTNNAGKACYETLIRFDEKSTPQSLGSRTIKDLQRKAEDKRERQPVQSVPAVQPPAPPSAPPLRIVPKQPEQPRPVQSIQESPTPPPTTQQPVTQQPQGDTVIWIKEIQRRTRISDKNINTWIDRNVGEGVAWEGLTEQETIKLISEMAIAYGKQFFSAEDHCRNHFNGRVGFQLNQAAHPLDAILVWISAAEQNKPLVPTGRK